MSISVTHLSKTFGAQKAVDNISFTVGSGTIAGFLGPNGAGKSTTMKMLSTYLKPTSGSALVCGHDVVRQSMEVRRLIGYLAENNPLYYDMYVREYLEFVAGIHRMGSAGKKRVEEMIGLTGLQKEVGKKIGSLSKGYKQRVGLAQAMIHNPQVLILDEPTSGLDPNQLAEIRDLIISIGREKTVLLSTHIMQEVQAMCSRVVIISNGRIVADDDIGNIRSTGGSSGLLIEFGEQVNRTALEELKTADHIEHQDGNRWLIGSSNPDTLRKELMTWCISRDLTIISMQNSNRSLEDIFRQLTETP